MPRKKKEKPTVADAIDTKSLPWHKDYHDAGKYTPEVIIEENEIIADTEN